jgi:hypothetical protein
MIQTTSVLEEAKQILKPSCLFRRTALIYANRKQVVVVILHISISFIVASKSFASCLYELL